MYAITLYRPWSWYVSHGPKRVENRTWPPDPAQLKPGDVLAIHAGQGWDKCFYPDGRTMPSWAPGSWPQHPRSEAIPTGIVALVVFAGATAGTVASDSLGPGVSEWWRGPWGWLLGQVCAIDPVPCSGKQGLWVVPEDVEQKVRAAYARRKGGV